VAIAGAATGATHALHRRQTAGNLAVPERATSSRRHDPAQEPFLESVHGTSIEFLVSVCVGQSTCLTYIKRRHAEQRTLGAFVDFYTAPRRVLVHD
jgi:hypothetical protein